MLELLGEGGMGQVYAGREVGTGRPVALKLLRPELVWHPDAARRFQREAIHMSALAGPHAVRVFDVGVADSGQPYMAMERLYGEDLAQVLEREGPLPVLDAVHWVKQACAAMRDAHARGILHRDLKPSNLFVAHDGEGRVLKVLDFGISRDIDEKDCRLTKTATTIGTPAYMSPEQARSASGLDVRTDVWSLGVILYELLTDALPFDASSATAAALAACNDDPVPPTERRPDLTRSIEAVILRALAKSPADRYASVDELAAALDLALLSDPDAPTDLARISAPRRPRAELLQATTIADQPRIASRRLANLALGGAAAFIISTMVLALTAGAARLSPEPAWRVEREISLSVLSIPVRAASAVHTPERATPKRLPAGGAAPPPFLPVSADPDPAPAPAWAPAPGRETPKALLHRPVFNERR